MKETGDIAYENRETSRSGNKEFMASWYKGY